MKAVQIDSYLTSESKDGLLFNLIFSDTEYADKTITNTIKIYKNGDFRFDNTEMYHIEIDRFYKISNFIKNICNNLSLMEEDYFAKNEAKILNRFEKIVAECVCHNFIVTRNAETGDDPSIADYCLFEIYSKDPNKDFGVICKAIFFKPKPVLGSRNMFYELHMTLYKNGSVSISGGDNISIPIRGISWFIDLCNHQNSEIANLIKKNYKMVCNRCDIKVKEKDFYENENWC